MKTYFYIAVFLISTSIVSAQENLDYQVPSKEILELVNAVPVPSVLIDDDNEFMILIYRDSYKTIAELSEEELRLGGLRINPKTYIGSRTENYNNIKVLPITEKEFCYDAVVFTSLAVELFCVVTFYCFQIIKPNEFGFLGMLGVRL